MENQDHQFKISLHHIDSIEFVEEADIPQIEGNLQHSDSSSGSFDLVRDLNEVPDTFLGIIDKYENLAFKLFLGILMRL